MRSILLAAAAALVLAAPARAEGYCHSIAGDAANAAHRRDYGQPLHTLGYEFTRELAVAPNTSPEMRRLLKADLAIQRRVYSSRIGMERAAAEAYAICRGLTGR